MFNVTLFDTSTLWYLVCPFESFDLKYNRIGFPVGILNKVFNRSDNSSIGKNR